MTFFDVITNGGLVGFLLWITLLPMIPVGVLLGAVAVWRACVAKDGETPYSFKLLIVVFVLYLSVGTLEVMNAMIDVLGAIESGNVAGAAKAQVLVIAISNSLYAGSFALLGSFPFILFIAIVQVILHCRRAELNSSEAEAEVGE